nr:uncharacterized protein K02A2.6-like [Lytechinus pictus]
MTSIPPPSFFLQNPGKPTTPWNLWFQQFENYLLASGGSEFLPDRKKALLSRCLGAEGQRIFYTLDISSPSEPRPARGAQAATNVYQEALAAIEAYFVPRINVVAERYRFRRRKQRLDETVAEYVAALQELVKHCAFANLKDEMLRDQVVEGCHNPRIRERLLLESDLNLQKVLDFSRCIEDAQRDSKAIAKGHESDSEKMYELHRKKTKEGRVEGRERKKTEQKTQKNSCRNCGSPSHAAFDERCKARESKCYSCGKTGHWAKVCRKSRRVRKVKSGADELEMPKVLTVNTHPTKPIRCEVELAGKAKIHMTIDTGSSVSIIPLSIYKKHFLVDALKPAHVSISDYSEGNIPVVGILETQVKVGAKSMIAKIFVVHRGSALLGLDIFDELKLKIEGSKLCVETVRSDSPTPESTSSTSSDIPQGFPTLFAPGLGCAHNFKHRVKVKANHPPVQQRLRRLPLSVKDQVSQELKRLEKEGVIEKIDSSEWISPIVVAAKKSGSIRLCVDLREVNKAIVVDSYPLPDIGELFSELEGSTVFSKMDLASAYHQLELDEESRDLTAFITHDGLYRFKRVCFGLASAPSTFQKLMSSILAGLPGVQCYLDDIIVYGKDRSEHDKHLNNVLKKLQDAGLRLNPSKCQFYLSELSYLGHCVSSKGLSPDDSHVQAILEAPAPTDVSKLRSVLGMTNYYTKFVPNYATVVEPMRRLLCKDVPFEWGAEQQEAYDKVKSTIAKRIVLGLFNPNLHTVVTTDASDYGLGAVLSQVKEGQEIPIAFASRSLSPAERKYSTGEKEALACVWACNKWYTYLWGRHFVLRTDHKALVTMLSTRGTGRQTMRIARWSAQLLQFDYTVEYKAGRENYVADALSRLPLGDEEWSDVVDEEEYVLNQVRVDSPVTVKELQDATNNDEVLVQVRKYIEEGWSGNHKSFPPEIKPYLILRDELSVVDDIVMRGNRIVIPTSLQAKFVDFAHSAHQGIVRTKQRLRETYWFPHIDKIVEETIKRCVTCQENDKSHRTHSAPMQSVEFPNSPWEKISIDITGPFENAPHDQRYAIVVVDYHSKWPEVAFCSNVTSRSVIQVLKTLFTREGLPTHLVSDNGPQFVSYEFEEFLEEYGITHVRSSLYYPRANGEVERFNMVLKSSIQNAMIEGKRSFKETTLDLLLAYRSTPHQVTGLSPSELLHGRKMRTKLDVKGRMPVKTERKKNEVKRRVKQKQRKSEEYTDAKRKARVSEFQVGSFVRVRKQRHVKKGTPKFGEKRKIIKQKGKATFELDDHTIWDAFHLSPCTTENHTSVAEREERQVIERDLEDRQIRERGLEERRRSSRVRKEPTYLQDYVRY